MFETVTVDEAIAKGKRMVNYPGLSIMLILFGLCFYLGIEKILPFWIVPVGFGLAFVVAWLYWSIMITKWRLWAFNNVRNVHELKRRAIQEKLIWPDHSIFVKTEIRNSTEKKTWNSLQIKFQQEDVFEDDLTVPVETIIYYSKEKTIIELTILMILLGIGIYLLATTDSPIIGAISVAISVYYGFKKYKTVTNTAPQIILNNKGIKTISTDFYEWSAIENEEVISEGFGDSTRFYLIYDHPDGAEYLQIEHYNTNQKNLTKLLTLYRGRSKKKNSQH